MRYLGMRRLAVTTLGKIQMIIKRFSTRCVVVVRPVGTIVKSIGMEWRTGNKANMWMSKGGNQCTTGVTQPTGLR